VISADPFAQLTVAAALWLLSQVSGDEEFVRPYNVFFSYLQPARTTST
jgi:hypothetical protein